MIKWADLPSDQQIRGDEQQTNSQLSKNPWTKEEIFRFKRVNKIVLSKFNENVHVNVQTLIDNNYTECVLRHLLYSMMKIFEEDMADVQREKEHLQEDVGETDKYVVILIIDISSSWHTICPVMTLDKDTGITIIRQRFETSIMSELSQLLNFLSSTVLDISKFRQYLQKNYNIPDYYQLGAIIIDNLSYFNFDFSTVASTSSLSHAITQMFNNSTYHHFFQHNFGAKPSPLGAADNTESLNNLMHLLHNVRQQYGALAITVSFDNRFF
ncbi:hypothetical protein ACO0QE_001926 [Hanseniaspora vineae]